MKICSSRSILFSQLFAFLVFLLTGPSFAESDHARLTPSGQLNIAHHMAGDEIAARYELRSENVLRVNVDITHDGSHEVGGNWFGGDALITAGQTPTLEIGADFVIEHGDSGTTFYDFRHRRIIYAAEAEESLINHSLYGLWFMRWAFLNNNSFVGSVLTAVGDGAETNHALTRYWLEQKNGVHYPKVVPGGKLPKPKIVEAKNGSNRQYSVGEETVAFAEMSGTPYIDQGQAQSFAAWLVWSQRAHPELAALFASENVLPSRIDITHRNNFLSKLTQYRATFSNPTKTKAGFTFLKLRNYRTPSWQPYFSAKLGAIMTAALRGEWENGPPSAKDFRAAINSAKTNGTPLDVALISIHASLGCSTDQPIPDICDYASRSLRVVLEKPKVMKLTQGLDDDNAGDHAAAAKKFMGLRSEDLARPDILEIMIANSLVEAKNNDQLDDALTREFDKLPMTFEAAFSRDPYSPSRYRDFYNYLHTAASEIEETYAVHVAAYPVIDAARALPERSVPKIVEYTTNLENRIAADFPIHFPNPEK